MTTRIGSRPVPLGLVAIAAAALLACGGNPPASSSAPSANAENAPAPPETAAPPAPAPPRSAPRAPSRAASKPASQPAPKPAPVVKTVAPGTQIDVELLDGASSKTSQIGQEVRARVTHAVSVDGVTVIPSGTIVTGSVTEAVPLKKIGGAASLGLKFSRLEVEPPVAIDTSIEIKGKSETGKDAGTIAGATAGGALLGRILAGKHDKTKGTLLGAVVGAAAGTGAAAATKGQEVELPAGTPLTLKLEDAASVTVQP